MGCMQTKSPKGSKSFVFNSAITEEGFSITPELMKIIHSHEIGPSNTTGRDTPLPANPASVKFHSFGYSDIYALALSNEFKKFIAAIIADNLAEIASPFNSDIFVPLDYVATPFVDRYWRYALAHHHSFQSFCMKVFKFFAPETDLRPFIVGPNNLNLLDDGEVFDRYKASTNLLKRYYGSVNPFYWLEYANETILSIHFRSCVWINQGMENWLLQFFGNYATETIQDFETVVEEFQRLARNGEESVQASEPLLRLVSMNSQKNLDRFVDPENQLKLEFLFDETIYNTPLPNDMIVTLSKEQLISMSEARLWVLEYKRFILMRLLSKIRLVPSLQVEQVWRLHLCYAESYKKFLAKLAEHGCLQFDLSIAEDDRDGLSAAYNCTLDFYSALFGNSLSYDCWQIRDCRFSEETSAWYWISLVDLFAFSQKTRSSSLLASSKSQAAERDLEFSSSNSQ